VGEVSGDARSAADIVQSEVGDTGVELHQQGQGLANAARGTEDGDLGELYDGLVSIAKTNLRPGKPIGYELVGQGWSKVNVRCAPRRRKPDAGS
jgi:hypothetical protein